MSRYGWLSLLAAGLGLCLLAAADDAPSVDLMMEIPYGGRGPAVAFLGESNTRVQGPNAVAMGPDGAVWLLDNSSRRALAYDRTGRRLRSVDLRPLHADDLAVAPDGTLALLRLHLARVDLLTADGQPAGSVPLSIHLGPVRYIGFTLPGNLEVENAHGERFDLGRPGRLRSLRAVLLDRRRGPSGSSLDCGVRVDQGRAFLYLWPEASGVTSTRRPEPEIRELDLGEVAAARPVSPCSRSGLLLEVERLGAGRTMQVTREVAFVRYGQVEASWQVAVPEVMPFRSFASRGPDTVMLLPLERGVQLWRWRMP